MSDVPRGTYIVQAFFGPETDASGFCVSRDPPKNDSVDFLRCKLWRPVRPDSDSPVFDWAIDCVTSRDERWCVFGPYDGLSAAKLAASELVGEHDWCYGYRIMREHWFSALRGKSISLAAHLKMYPNDAYTDG
jgi:hypothetical protein